MLCLCSCFSRFVWSHCLCAYASFFQHFTCYASLCLLFLCLSTFPRLFPCSGFYALACLFAVLLCCITLVDRLSSYVLSFLSCLLFWSNRVQMPRGHRRILHLAGHPMRMLLCYFIASHLPLMSCLWIIFFHSLPILDRPDDLASNRTLPSHIHPTLYLGTSISFQVLPVYMRYVTVPCLSIA